MQINETVNRSCRVMSEFKRSQRWLQVLIVLAGGAFLWLIYRVAFTPD